MARVFYLGAPSRVQLLPSASLEEAINATGGNTGNLLIGHALRRQLKAECLISRRALGLDYISRNFDYIVLGASNFLYRNFDFSFWADFLERVKLPCTIIGLGAQAPDYGHPVEVAPGTRRLIDIIAERSTTLGVRGHWTAEVLHGLGIKNVRVIGCPAMYWLCQPELELRPLKTERPLNIALNGAAQAVAHASDPAAARAVEFQLTRLSARHGYPYILQNAVDLAKLAAGATAPDGELVQKLMDAFGLSELGPEGFLTFVRQHTGIYFKVAQWHKAMESFDFVVGSRFHGCLIAVLAGVPSFVLAHDARTREMCELLGLPHRQAKEAGPVDLEALYAELDLGTLKRRYRQLYRNYIEFLEENRVEHSLRLPPREGQEPDTGGQKSEIQNRKAGVGEQTTQVGI